MKIKVATATNTQINWLVGIAQGWTVYPTDSIEHGDTFHLDPARTPFGPTLAVSSFNPSTNWSQGGPIIERENLSVFAMNTPAEGWCSHHHSRRADGSVGKLDQRGYGPTPLIAAMRCYVASKLGEEVEVPDDLV